MGGVIIYAEQADLEHGECLEIKVWAVRPSARFPLGVKFSFVLATRDGEGGRIYGVDNAHGLGPHEHTGSARRPLAVDSWEAALHHFREAVRSIRAGRRDAGRAVD